MMQAAQRSGNRLAKEKSPYLLQHAYNPVDWYPWGKEAFERARRENKPIFLSVGYSTCHWCHVMERESFENEEVALLLNQFFIPVKVDREERPDVDRVYMSFVQATTGGGGWPMSVWLTPELKPFVGGTYFPPDDRYGRMGFPSVLRRIAEAWQADRERLVSSGEQMISALRDAATATPQVTDVPGLGVSDLLFAQLSGSFDSEQGGFGSAPKFPRPVILTFLFRYHHRTGNQEALRMALVTLDKMAAGGMHDHLGGGFHRYSVDAQWHVPHFEKMLYDQAQLALAYIEAFQITGEPRYQAVARGILDYVLRDMTSSTGGFFSAEDADSQEVPGAKERKEGAFYAWTREEVDRVLGEQDAAIFCRFYGVESGGNVAADNDPHGELEGKNILIQRYTAGEVARIVGSSEEEVLASLARSRSILLETRAGRPRPHLDDKIITAWNGLMLSAFAKAAQVFDDEHYREAARQAAKFLRDQPKLMRSFRDGPSAAEPFADDYAFLIQGLLDLYEATFDLRWLTWASSLQDEMDARFWDTTAGGYFSVTGDDPSILLRLKEDHDGAEPSPNSVAALNLLRLTRMTGQPRREKAEQTIRAFADPLQNMPAAVPLMVSAVEALAAIPVQVVIAGSLDDPAAHQLAETAVALYRPDRTILLADSGEAQRWLGQHLEFIRSVAPVHGVPAAYVCENFTCKPPVTTPGELKALLSAKPRA